MKNIAKALLAIISIAGVAIAAQGIEVLRVDDGIEVLSINENGVSYGIEVLAAEAPQGSMVMATMQVDGETHIVDTAALDANGVATVVFPVMQAGNHIHLMANPSATSQMSSTSGGGYQGSVTTD